MGHLNLVPRTALPMPAGIVRLADTGACDLGEFDCGDPGITAWLRTKAATSDGHTARINVCLVDGKVVAFYSIHMGSMERSHLPGTSRSRQGLPDPLPVAVVGRLGVTRAYQGRGVAKGLMRHAMRLTLHLSEQVGTFGLIVQPVTPRVADFYRRMKFVDFRQPTAGQEGGASEVQFPAPMFASIDYLRAMFADVPAP